MMRNMNDLSVATHSLVNRQSISLTQWEAIAMYIRKFSTTWRNAFAAGLLAFFMSTSVSLQAQEDDSLERPPEIPPLDAEEQPLPPKIQDEQVEPTVTIRDEDGKRVEEYSYNGQVYMVKITPEVGPPYYFIDSDGDGNLETTPTKGLEPVQPVQWKIKEWR